MAGQGEQKCNFKCWQSLFESSQLAVLNFRLRKNFFPITPKHHMMYHVLKTIQWQGDICEHAWNPLSEFCAMDEDFIGRVAKISRNVSPRTTCLRVVQRYLLYCRSMWFDDMPDKPFKRRNKFRLKRARTNQNL